MIIDPWGTVVAVCPDGPGYAVAKIDMARLKTVRDQVPCLAHRRLRVPEAGPDGVLP